MERVGAKRKETKSTGRSEKYFRAVVTPNREKPKKEAHEVGCSHALRVCRIFKRSVKAYLKPHQRRSMHMLMT